MLLTEFHPTVPTSLLDHAVFKLTVNRTVILKHKSSLLEDVKPFVEEFPPLFKPTMLTVLMELTDIKCVGEPMVRLIGLLKILGGAEMAGRTFASCLLEIGASAFLDDVSTGGA